MAKHCHSKITGRFVSCKRQAAAKARCRAKGKFANCLAGSLGMSPPPFRTMKGNFVAGAPSLNVPPPAPVLDLSIPPLLPPWAKHQDR